MLSEQEGMGLSERLALCGARQGGRWGESARLEQPLAGEGMKERDWVSKHRAGNRSSRHGSPRGSEGKAAHAGRARQRILHSTECFKPARTLQAERHRGNLFQKESLIAASKFYLSMSK